MSDEPKYQLTEEIKVLERSLKLLNDERDILWDILDSMSTTQRNCYTKQGTKIASLHESYTKEQIEVTSGEKGREIERKMKSLGFVETTAKTMHYSLSGSDRKFRVRGRSPAVVVEKSECLKVFDRWANSIESIYYLTNESGVDLLEWATKDEKEVKDE